MKDFYGFINAYGNKYRPLVGNIVAQDIYAWLSQLSIILSMCQASNAGQPALLGCVTGLEAQFGNQQIFDLKQDYHRQAIGAMIKTIIQPFGYQKVGRKNIPVGRSQYFSSATVYSQIGSVKYEIIQNFELRKITTQAEEEGKKPIESLC